VISSFPCLTEIHIYLNNVGKELATIIKQSPILQSATLKLPLPPLASLTEALKSRTRMTRLSLDYQYVVKNEMRKLPKVELDVASYIPSSLTELNFKHCIEVTLNTSGLGDAAPNLLTLKLPACALNSYEHFRGSSSSSSSSSYFGLSS